MPAVWATVWKLMGRCSLIPRRAQRDVDELIVLEAFENVSDLGFAGLKGESYGRKKNKTCRRWEQPRQDEAKKT